MKIGVIIAIVCGGLMVLILIAAIIGRISVKKKKTISEELKSRLEKVKKSQTSYVEPKIEEQKGILEFEKELQPIKKSKGSLVVSEYNPDEGFEQEVLPEPLKKEPVQRMSFDQLLKNRQNRVMSQQPLDDDMTDFDDFEDFRTQHSAYSTYQTDQTLVDEIKGLSPKLKAIVFGNLFNKINSDKF